MKVQMQASNKVFTETELKLIEKAREAGQLAESELVTSEQNASVSQNFVDKLIESGITRTMLPKEYGGPQISLRGLGAIVRTIAYHNISAAWVGYFFPLHNSLPSHLPQEGRDEIVKSEDLIVDVFAPVGQMTVVEGGIRLTGTYNYTSGVAFAKWIGLGGFAQLPESDRPEFLMCFIRKDEVQVNINWDTFGLRGSGSNQVVATDVFIPRSRILRLEVANDTRRPPEGSNYDSDYPFYHVPFFSAFYLGFPNMALGGAKRLIDEYKKRTEARVRLHGENEKDSPRSQRILAKLMLQYKKAIGLMDQYYELLATYETEGPYEKGEFSAIRAEIIKISQDIATTVMVSLGGAALTKNDTIEVFVRDIIAVASHVTSLYEDAVYSYGRNLYGYQGIGWG
ncbi:acyl-CoA dehydrogenase [Alkalihalobacillus sp. BA299]|uniref:acyl-CoA dehydrogenase n=1 Tax=Alkalihalobacillus sp. BA299 TaxID=2815938 RepID=UPI001FFE03D9|nr:acyl-CoA dehydrogenase [Alkalihalobacillus sp. BA299]